MNYKNLVEQLLDEENCNVLDCIDDAADAIQKLCDRAEKAERAIDEISEARRKTRPAYIVDDIIRKFYEAKED